MPEKRIGTCDVCGRHNVERTLIVGGVVDGRIYIGWVCSRCRADLRKLREEMLNHGGSESQERNPRE